MCTQIPSFSGGKKKEMARRRRAKRKNEENARRRRAKIVKGGPEGPPFYMGIYKNKKNLQNLKVFLEKKPSVFCFVCFVYFVCILIFVFCFYFYFYFFYFYFYFYFFQRTPDFDPPFRAPKKIFAPGGGPLLLPRQPHPSYTNFPPAGVRTEALYPPFIFFNGPPILTPFSCTKKEIAPGGGPLLHPRQPPPSYTNFRFSPRGNYTAD